MARIYLSATYNDLKPYRDDVYRILRMLRHDVVAMEDYVATDVYPLHKCLDDVASSDIYVGLLGWRYGYIPEQDNPEQKSITELEYRQTGKSGLARLIFIVAEEVPWEDAFRDSETGEGEGGQRIAALRAEIEQITMVSHFRTPDHLAGLVSVAVQHCLGEKRPVRKGARQRVLEVKCRALHQRLNSLLEEYQAATEQLAYTLSAMDQARIKRQVEGLEREMAHVEDEVNAIGCS